ncbi:MAG: pantetheine-phosphate adenylyltransferase [Turicibacter sp.]|nr:pantetheine-phosphate adenylyltransferase [Turicibacter sp.]
MRIAVYPGSFDPITNGHLDIIKRGAKLFDKLYIALSENVSKQSLFTLEERMDLTREATADLKNVEVVVASHQLTVDFATAIQASVILRGLRAATDFEYEFTMAMTNSKLNAEIETVFLTADNEHMYLSSSMIKEIAKFSGDVTNFVPPCVATAIGAKFDD